MLYRAACAELKSLDSQDGNNYRPIEWTHKRKNSHYISMIR
ncbi:hypothetical protein D1AOALGA4SA_8965 [Olavius algarvensis Delta 1 endosymbiont]|nr:hypothetical protein D1AOALGA4SA_8965 [Olavius algarvensis Delta 1 endosymbiont]